MKHAGLVQNGLLNGAKLNVGFSRPNAGRHAPVKVARSRAHISFDHFIGFHFVDFVEFHGLFLL